MAKKCEGVSDPYSNIFGERLGVKFYALHKTNETGFYFKANTGNERKKVGSTLHSVLLGILSKTKMFTFYLAQWSLNAKEAFDV